MYYCKWQAHAAEQDVVIFEVNNARYRLHGHRGFHELMIVARGTLRHRVNGKSSLLRAGELTLIREQDCHELLGGDCTCFNLPFTLDWLKRIELLLACPGWTDAIFAEEPPLVQIPPKEWPTFLEKVNDLLHEIDVARLRPQFASLLLSFFSWFVHAPAVSPRLENQAPVWLSRLLAELGRSLPLESTVADLAAAADCTPEHLARTFRRYLQQSPGEYLNAQRLRYAVNLLLHTNRRIKEIATLCGFHAESYFCRQFRRLYGMRPGVYRMVHLSRALFPIKNKPGRIP